VFVISGACVWLTLAALNPELPQERSPLQFYSNQTRQDLKLTLLSALKKAEKSIDLSMYALTDPDLIQLLKNKDREGVRVRVRYDASASPNLRNLLFPIDAAPVKSEGLMHRKIVVIDDALVFLGSANMTPQSLKIHDNLMIGSYHPELAHFLSHSPTLTTTFSLHGQDAEMWLLPDKSGTALKRLVELVKSAQKTIRIAMFTLTHPELVEALIAASSRGVAVKCAIDYYTGQGASLKAAQKLRAGGVSILLSRGGQLLHHKWAYIDSTQLAVGSANWTQAAFLRNQDCFLILKSLHSKHKRFMNRLWNNLEQGSEVWTG
jgi:cardiolipin synthase